MPPQFVLSDEKSGGAAVQQSLRGIALSKKDTLNEQDRKSHYGRSSAPPSE